MKRRYRTRVSVEGATEETQFIPLADSSPRIKTHYERDPARHGKYKNEREYLIDPEKLNAPAEEASAADDPAIEEQREQEKAEAKAAKKGRK